MVYMVRKIPPHITAEREIFQGIRKRGNTVKKILGILCVVGILMNAEAAYSFDVDGAAQLGQIAGGIACRAVWKGIKSQDHVLNVAINFLYLNYYKEEIEMINTLAKKYGGKQVIVHTFVVNEFDVINKNCADEFYRLPKTQPKD